MPEISQYLVIDSTITKTVTHGETGQTRLDIGNSAAHMATALARTGHDTTLITHNVSQPDPETISQIAIDAGIQLVSVEHQPQPSWNHFTTIKGHIQEQTDNLPNVEDVITGFIHLLDAPTRSCSTAT